MRTVTARKIPIQNFGGFIGAAVAPVVTGAILDRTGGNYTLVVQVRVAGETARRRVEARGHARDRSKLADWNSFWEKASTTRCQWEGARLLVVDGVDAEAAVLAAI